ncbi:MAG: transcriptional regulator [Candidatus Omnitrophica bacterium]|nr:transcriptional regulator [Candidatus Omnitrophota bacterium]
MKSMQQPQEIEVWYVLPAIRREFVLQLKKQGIKQKDISKIMRITEPAVSQYVKDKRAKGIKFDKRINDAIARAAQRITNQRITKQRITNQGLCIIHEIQVICKQIRKDGQLCRIHKKLSKGVSSNCSVCCT